MKFALVFGVFTLEKDFADAAVSGLVMLCCGLF